MNKGLDYFLVSERQYHRLQRESGGVRVAFIPNVDGESKVDQSLNKVVLAALTTLEPVKAMKYVVQLLDDEGCHERQDCDILVS